MSPQKGQSITTKHVLVDRKLVPDEQLKVFCDVLHFEYEHGDGWREGEDGINRYVNRIRPLIPRLRYPLAKANRVERLLIGKRTTQATLCNAHIGLNADFVQQWFKYLTLEVGARLEILRYSNPTDWTWYNVIIPCFRLNRIWTKPHQLKDYFGINVDTESKNEFPLIENDFQTNECKACILARIGSHPGTLLALNSCIRSRISFESHRKHPNRLRLLRLVGPWLDSCLDKNTSNSLAAKRLISAIEDLHLTRKRLDLDLMTARSAAKTEDPFENPFNSIEDAENDVIDTYAALRATQRFSSMLSPIKETGSASKNSPYSYSDPAYNESRYSINTVANNARVIGTPSRMFDTDKRKVKHESALTVWPVKGTGSGAF